MTLSSPELTCHICSGTETDPRLLIDCSWCGSFFHLNPFQNREGKDCGNVTTGDLEEPVLQFFCNRCMGLESEPAPGTASAPPESALPPIEATQQPGARRFRRIDR